MLRVTVRPFLSKIAISGLAMVLGAVSLPSTVAASCRHCYDCEVPGIYYIEPLNGDDTEGSTQTCGADCYYCVQTFNGSFSRGSFLADLHAYIPTILGGGPAAVARASALLSQYPLFVRLNYERNALQIVSSCSDGEFYAGHIPLKSDLVIALAAVVRQQFAAALQSSTLPSQWMNTVTLWPAPAVKTRVGHADMTLQLSPVASE